MCVQHSSRQRLARQLHLRTHPYQLHLAGSKIIVLISDNQASKLAFKLGKALLQPRDELQLVTVVLGEESVPYGSGLLAPYLPSAQQQQQQGPTINPVVRCAGQQHAAHQDQHQQGKQPVDSRVVPAPAGAVEGRQPLGRRHQPVLQGCWC
jgi:hypothetical protein